LKKGKKKGLWREFSKGHSRRASACRAEKKTITQTSSRVPHWGREGGKVFSLPEGREKQEEEERGRGKPTFFMETRR